MTETGIEIQEQSEKDFNFDGWSPRPFPKYTDITPRLRSLIVKAGGSMSPWVDPTGLSDAEYMQKRDEAEENFGLCPKYDRFMRHHDGRLCIRRTISKTTTLRHFDDTSVHTKVYPVYWVEVYNEKQSHPADVINTESLVDPQPDPAPYDPSKPATWDLACEWIASVFHPAIAKPLIKVCRERDEFGARKYTTRLQPHNTRNNVVDALQEHLDALVYHTNAIYQLHEDDDEAILHMEGRMHAASGATVCLRIIAMQSQKATEEEPT